MNERSEDLRTTQQAGDWRKSQFAEMCELLGRLQSAVRCRKLSRNDVAKLRGLLEAGMLAEDILLSEEPKAATHRDDLWAVAIVNAEWPVLFYAFCCVLNVDAQLTVTEADTHDQAIAALSRPEAKDVWQRLHAAAMCKATDPSRLVTVKEVADYRGINRNSQATMDWPNPVEKAQGRLPAKYRWGDLRPVLEKRYPDDDWDSF